MTNIIEKARLGRMNALAGLSSPMIDQPRSRSMIRHEKVTFISSRARAAGETVQF